MKEECTMLARGGRRLKALSVGAILLLLLVVVS
jgi:hypothetical protein